MEPIKNTVEDVLKALSCGKGNLGVVDFDLLLKNVLTKRELKHIKFNYFRNGVLGLAVDSSGWMYQLNLSKEKLLAKLKKEIKEAKEIKFRLGQI